MKRNDDYRDGGSLLAGSRILFPPSLSLRLKRESSSAVAWRVVRDAQTIGHFPTEGGTLQGRAYFPSFPPILALGSRWGPPFVPKDVSASGRHRCQERSTLEIAHW